jgi:ribosomal protein S27AE
MGMFGKDLGKLKVLCCGVVGILWRCLKRRKAAGGLMVIPLDEFKTSRICSKCGTDSLDSVNQVNDYNVLVSKPVIQLAKRCQRCQEHDVNFSFYLER